MKQLCFFVLLLVSLPLYSHHQLLHIALFTQREAADDFWRPVSQFALAAGKGLGIRVSLWHAGGSKSKMLQNLRDAKQDGVDAVIFPNLKKSALSVLKEAEALKLPVFLINADLDPTTRQSAGVPGQQFTYWLGRMIPDDGMAGYILAKYLIAAAREAGMVDSNDLVHMVAINGPYFDEPARLRRLGLEKAIGEDGQVVLHQLVEANWQRFLAKQKMIRLRQRFPQARVIWVASDNMALGAWYAMAAAGKKQGQDYLMGGIDWTYQGLTAVNQNKLLISVGGHVMEAAWALVMLYDYFHGIAINPADSLSNMSVMTPAMSMHLLPRLMYQNWSGIDFKSLTKTHGGHSHYVMGAKWVYDSVKVGIDSDSQAGVVDTSEKERQPEP